MMNNDLNLNRMGDFQGASQRAERVDQKPAGRQPPRLMAAQEEISGSPFCQQRLALTGLRERDASLPEDIVDSILPSRAATLLAAHGGAGKSMLALQMAVCVAAGRPFMGRKVAQAPVTL